MEEFVRRLFNDGDFRREFLANPAQVITDSGLTHSERNAVMSLSGQLSSAAVAPRPGVLSVDVVAWE